MSSITIAPPPKTAGPPIQKETTAGNYFVANYPPFAFWKEEAIPEFEAALERPPRPGVPLGLYTHIPFCRKRCHFCYFRVYTDKNAEDIKGYIDTLLKELAVYAAKPVIGGRKPKFIYFGGGTPSYLSPDQLKFLTDGMKRLLPWDEAEEVTFEGEPGTLTDHKLRAIRDLGVTRLSLGIEHFDDHILEVNGRAHRSKEVLRAYNYAREIGFPQINIDLIAGMVEETEEKWKEAVAKAVELRPDSVTIYQMEVPYNTGIYQQMKAEGKLVAPVADWATKRRWVDYAYGEFEKIGYTVTSTTTVVKDPAKVKFVYRQGLFSGADILSIGVASFGHLNGVHYQNEHDFQPYVEAVNAGRLPTHRAYTVPDDERYLREFMLQLKLGSVSADAFTRKFGRDPREQFAAPLATLKDQGFLTNGGDRIGLTRDALLQVDRLLHEFFKPEHKTGRYA
ncbi:MAG TPA: coproporphyrinogen-III oxidase family protein [Candidatus Limnocylindria bacterium]|nr:coproporphyrinogen-III oxidase family protein [Candidatus Limnocylindria bacterium]